MFGQNNDLRGYASASFRTSHVYSAEELRCMPSAHWVGPFAYRSLGTIGEFKISCEPVEDSFSRFKDYESMWASMAPSPKKATRLSIFRL